jgi:hypothetical protein
MATQESRQLLNDLTNCWSLKVSHGEMTEAKGIHLSALWEDRLPSMPFAETDRKLVLSQSLLHYGF